MKMKTTLSLVAAAVALLSHSAFAQQTREERKADTAAAVKAGETPKAGEGGPAVQKPTQSTKTRSDRKSETAAAVKSGETPKAGEGGPAVQKPTQSTKTREERKSETAAAVKSGETPKAGEAPAGQKK
jgi:hypothetical protein